MNIKDVINQLGGGVLSESDGQMLMEAFNEAVVVKVNEQVDLKVKDALVKLDEDHSAKLEQLLEAIDNDHSNKLIEVLKRIDEDHTKKLQYLILQNRQALNEDAKEFKGGLVKQISNYMDIYLEKTVPVEQLKEAVANKRAQKIVDSIKQAVSLDEQFVDKTIKEAVQNGKQQIDNLRQELNEQVKMNMQVSQQLKARTSELMLEKYTAGLNKDKKNYVMRMLGNKDPEFIKENFEPVVEMFDREEDNRVQSVRVSVGKQSRIINEKIDTPKAPPVITESTTQDGVDPYLQALQKQDRFSIITK